MGLKALSNAVLATLLSGGISAFSHAGDPVRFDAEIRPLLEAHCVKCHGPERQKGGLRLDHRLDAFKGGDSGQRGIVPGHSAQSRLFQVVSSTKADERMPPKGDPLDPRQLELLKRWIDLGADWPSSGTNAATSVRAEMKVSETDRQHWSFLPLRRVELPPVTDNGWVRTPVDRFIRQAQEAKSLQPSTSAAPRALVRRIYFDLIGLPPTPEEMERWSALASESPGASRGLVEALLASPHYGERWARHWLDVARYADSSGMEGDSDRANAYRYRDFVIRALNEDLPYDTFIRWQLAGDEIEPGRPEAIAATGFIAAGVNAGLPDKLMEEEKLRNRANELDDMVATTGQAMLGLTLACARCHDHKYDPLPTRDYYRLMRVFNSGDRTEVPLVAPPEAKAHAAAMAAWKRESEAVVKERDEWLKEVRPPIADRLLAERIAKLGLSEEEKALLRGEREAAAARQLADRFKKELRIEDSDCVAALPAGAQARWAELDARVKAVAMRRPTGLPMAFAFADFGAEPRETWFFERGNFMARRERMELGFLTVLTTGKTAADYWKAARETRRRDDSTQQRRALADWMTDIDHGAGALLARVMVNRVWQHHFGEGLVRTASDFGIRGELPTHPELLEWLAGEFVRSGWSVKHLHRLILTSATCQQTSAFDDRKSAIDPENRLLWRRRPLRLESETLRDSMLSVAGTLNPAVFGPGFKPPIPAEAVQARNVKDPYPADARDTPETRRRTIYLFHKRVVQYPLMQAFDAPDAQQSCGRRMNTTVAPQALSLLNDPFVRLRAEELAGRLQSVAATGLPAQIQMAFQLCLGRPAGADELRDVLGFVSAQRGARTQRDPKLASADAQRLALVDFCQSLFGLNEFIYVD
jgi:hypothetical protein